MVKVPCNNILKIIVNIILSVFTVICSYCWISMPRTNKYVAVAICMFAGIAIVFQWMVVFRKQMEWKVFRLLAIGAICVLVITNALLSVWYRSIQSAERQVLYYSAFFQPNGDMPMLHLLLDNQTIIVSSDEKCYVELLNKLGKEIIYKDLEKDAILETCQFEDMGQLRSLYIVYSPLFGLKYDDPEQIPRLYISPYGMEQNSNRIVFSDDAGNLYIVGEE